MKQRGLNAALVVCDWCYVITRRRTKNLTIRPIRYENNTHKNKNNQATQVGAQAQAQAAQAQAAGAGA
jgi:hypothetical protein